MNHRHAKFYWAGEMGVLLVMGMVLMGMGGAERNKNKKNEPEFTPLQEGQERFIGKLSAINLGQTSLRDLSFSGTTKLTGLRKEGDKSFNDIDLSVVSKIEVISSDYHSPEYSNGPEELKFVKAKITFNADNADNAKKPVVEEYLLPHNIEVSGIDAATGVEKTWRLRAIKELAIEEQIGLDTVEQELLKDGTGPSSDNENPGVVQRVVNSVKQFGNYIKSSLP